MEHYNDEIQLKDILIKLSEYKEYLLKKKATIFAFSFLLFVVGIIFAIQSRPEYTAQLTFVVEDEQKGSSLGGMSGIASQFGFDIGGQESSTFSQQNILQLLKSRGVVEASLLQEAKVMGQSDLLIEHYLTLNEIKELWAKNQDFKGVSFHDKKTYIHDSIIGLVWHDIVENSLLVEMQSTDANIINLSYTSGNEEFAKQFVEVLINEMSKMYVGHQTAQASNTLNFLQNRADSVFGELELAEEEFARVKDINQRIVKASGRLKELQLMRRVEVLNTIYLEILKNLELSKITLLNQTPIINIIDKPILPLEENIKSKSLGGILGGILGGFLSVFYFILSKLFKDVLAES